MANHRIEPQPQRWVQWLKGRIRRARVALAESLKPSEVIACGSEDFYLDYDHPWQSIPCLICAQPAGAFRVYCVAILGATVTTPAYYRAGSVAYIIHSDHGRLEPLELWILAHKRERPGCPCHSRTATIDRSWPVHQL